MKRALVTGGSGGIGSAICRELAKAGLAVIVHAHRHRSDAETVAADLRRDGGSASVVSFDVTDAGAVQQELTALLEAGPIQVLVHNAGIHDDAPMAGMSLDQWRRVIDVSLHGFFNVTQPLLLPMIHTRWGRIITVSSVAGVLGNRGQTNYAAAKAGLHGACKSLAREVASRGITANIVAPGIIDSAIGAEAFTSEQMEAMVPMKRAGRPEEVACLVRFLASEDAGYVSGQVIGINGGMV
ncbi:MAG: 3-oxoacyl-ACP reductase FabG [Nitrospiraceae bacterium]